MKERFKPTEIAKIFSVNRATVVNWINADKLPAYETVGGHYRINREDLINFATKQELPLPDEFKSTKYKVLIVDDEKNVTESIKLMLENIGVDLEIETAYDGFEAGIKAIRFLPHLIILDAIMPGANGDRICILTREDRALRNTRILVFTGYPDEGKRLLELGADKFIQKGTKEAEIKPFQKEICKLLDVKYRKVLPAVKKAGY